MRAERGFGGICSEARKNGLDCAGRRTPEMDWLSVAWNTVYGGMEDNPVQEHSGEENREGRNGQIHDRDQN